MMKRKLVVVAVVLLALATFGQAATQEETKDDIITADAKRVVGNHVFYTIFDFVQVKSGDGVVTLEGKVTEPYKKTAFGEEVLEEVEGVKMVHNNIDVMPPSSNDDALRIRIAREIYNDVRLLRYGLTRWPYPIHILVENGHVTLRGEVENKMDKQYIQSEVRQLFGIVSVDNALKVNGEEEETAEMMEKMNK